MESIRAASPSHQAPITPTPPLKFDELARMIKEGVDYPPGSKGKLPLSERSVLNLQIAKIQGEKEADKGFKLVEEPTESKISAGLYTRSLPSESFKINERVGGKASCQGLRKSMEDRDLAESIDHAEVYAIFDGHGGDEISVYVQKSLVNQLVQAFKKHQNPNEEQIWKGLKEDVFVPLDERCAEEFIGTTTTVAIILGGNLWIANIGDSRILLQKDGKTTQLTEDAKPTIPRYLRKIQKAGGKAISDLTVARTIGDKDYTGISAKPKISYLPLKQLQGGHLILACDGLFEKGSTKEVGAAVETMKQENQSCQSMAKRLVASAIHSGSRDNVSVMVIKV